MESYIIFITEVNLAKGQETASMCREALKGPQYYGSYMHEASHGCQYSCHVEISREKRRFPWYHHILAQAFKELQHSQIKTGLQT